MSDIRGIDVSRWQGDFDWHSQPGLSFGMAKATESGFTDPQFGANWDKMWWYQKDHRLPRFAYCFFRPARDPVIQAAHLVTAVKSHGLLPGDNLVCDLEVSDGLEPAVVAERAAAFLHRVNDLAPGHRVLVYTNPSFADAGNCAGLGSWHLWIADYGVPRPVVPQPWTAWAFWQYTASPLDTDAYNGTCEQLLAFTRMPDSR